MKKILMGAVALAMVQMSAAASAQDFPTGPIQIVVPFSAGGNVDVTARAVAPVMSEILGEAVVVENRTGAGGMIGAESVMSAEPDGHTLMMGSNSTVSVGPNLYGNWPYDPVDDVRPISIIQFVPFALVVREDSDIESLEDLLERAEAEPGAITQAHAGTGTSNHLVSELFKLRTGAEFLFVPYQGGAPAMTDLLGGQVDTYFDQASTTVQHVEGGRVRVLAVTSEERWPALPDVPTFAELGVEDFVVMNVTGLVGPAGMPDAVVDRLHEATVEALENPEVRERLEGLGVQVEGSTPEEFAEFIRNDLARWADVIEQAGVEAQ
jgi:tripartite-type tricarboxylate transporter receptor subunit TctC